MSRAATKHAIRDPYNPDLVVIGYILFLYAITYIDMLYGFAYKNALETSAMEQQIARSEKQLGAILRRARKKAGLTQSDLGKLRQGTVSRLEAGEPAIQLRTVMEALTALNLELIVRPRSKATAADIESIF
jgi:HTH-type transcriptional regulator / antitoxin HipB